MNRRGAVLWAGIIVALTGGALVAINTLLSPESIPHWELNVGDEIIYGVGVYGYDNTSPNHTIKYSELNNTRIKVRIVSLPELNRSYYASSFAKNVIEYQKAECTFENGSELPTSPSRYIENASQYLSTLISRCMLPVGAWNLIDDIFPDDPGIPWQCDTYLSKKYDNCFFIGYRSFNVDIGGGWNGNVTLAEGLPIFTESWLLWANFGGSYSSVVLTLAAARDVCRMDGVRAIVMLDCVEGTVLQEENHLVPACERKH